MKFAPVAPALTEDAPQSGTGLPCQVAQCDGVPCPDVQTDCEHCERSTLPSASKPRRRPDHDHA